jgi:hypothetical protein
MKNNVSIFRFVQTRYRKNNHISIGKVGLLSLLGNNLIFDLIVGRLRNDFLSNQLVLPLIRTILYYLLRVRITDSRKRFQNLRMKVQNFLRNGSVLRLIIFGNARDVLTVRARHIEPSQGGTDSALESAQTARPLKVVVPT